MNCTILAIVLLVNMSYASPAKDPPKQLVCKKTCKDDYTPLCGKPVDGKGTDITFGNNCVLDNYNCEKADKRELMDQKLYYSITNIILLSINSLRKVCCWRMSWKSTSSIVN